MNEGMRNSSPGPSFSSRRVIFIDLNAKVIHSSKIEDNTDHYSYLILLPIVLTPGRTVGPDKETVYLFPVPQLNSRDKSLFFPVDSVSLLVKKRRLNDQELSNPLNFSTWAVITTRSSGRLRGPPSLRPTHLTLKPGLSSCPGHQLRVSWALTGLAAADRPASGRGTPPSASATRRGHKSPAPHKAASKTNAPSRPPPSRVPGALQTPRTLLRMRQAPPPGRGKRRQGSAPAPSGGLSVSPSSSPSRALRRPPHPRSRTHPPPSSRPHEQAEKPKAQGAASDVYIPPRHHSHFLPFTVPRAVLGTAGKKMTRLVEP